MEILRRSLQLFNDNLNLTVEALIPGSQNVLRVEAVHVMLLTGSPSRIAILRYKGWSESQ